MKKNRKAKDEIVRIYKIQSLAQTLQDMNKASEPSDVLGSYTGMSSVNTNPEQDADDL